MTRDDIIRMAIKCELVTTGNRDGIYMDALARFAALVAAYIRETEFKPDWNNYRQGLTDGAAAEREACARVCEELELKSADGEWGKYVAGWSDGTDDCAAAIRARGGA